ncbi:mitochondrial carrier, partial [Hysterangium stoloniferum]
INEQLKKNKPVVSAITASLVSTLAGYPLDSLKSRMQASRKKFTVPGLAAHVFREEGIAGFYRGFWIPLVTISFVRAASFTIYNGTKEGLHERGLLTRARLQDVAGSGALGGAFAGALISFGSALDFFSLIPSSQVRRQLEYSIAEAKGAQIDTKPPNTLQAVRDIVRTSGFSGLYTGFPLHFVRDTAGTALYFLEYDSFRHLCGRLPSGEQGRLPLWLPIYPSLLPFLCGSLAGVSSWAIIYPLDVVKTKVQQRALSGSSPRSLLVTLTRLVRGPNPDEPQPIHVGIGRLYRGLGVSAARSVITHGLLWTVLDYISACIDVLPQGRSES